jgi:hypothetical protein
MPTPSTEPPPANVTCIEVRSGQKNNNNRMKKKNIDHNQQDPAPDKIITGPQPRETKYTTYLLALTTSTLTATIAWKEDMSIPDWTRMGWPRRNGSYRSQTVLNIGGWVAQNWALFSEL